jgi:rare lipoprotein A
MDTSLKRRSLFMVALTVVLLLATLLPAEASPHPPRWWQYDPETWSHSWKSVATLRHEENQWRRDNPDASGKVIAELHRRLKDEYLAMHFHEAAGVQRGAASWFSASHGACTSHTKGYYAASTTLPCGTEVSVRAGDKYVIVTIQDRGPYVGGRILDLSKAAFQALAPLGTGVVTVTATTLKN